MLYTVGLLIFTPLFLVSTRAEPNPPGFDAPDPEIDPDFHCPPGYFFEGNHEYQNGPARCTLMTCENHSDLPGCSENGNFKTNILSDKISKIGNLKQQIREELKHDTCKIEEIDGYMDTIQEEMNKNKYSFDEQIEFLQKVLEQLQIETLEKGDIDCGSVLIPLLPKPRPPPSPQGPIPIA
ncbi:MAG TPA: hypothetical protein VJ729_02170 [Nitrososphaeraceae archaeon]|nr:hypothetical protein [Nitrososphaeraceae archaeon]